MISQDIEQTREQRHWDKLEKARHNERAKVREQLRATALTNVVAARDKAQENERKAFEVAAAAINYNRKLQEQKKPFGR